MSSYYKAVIRTSLWPECGSVSCCHAVFLFPTLPPLTICGDLWLADSTCTFIPGVHFFFLSWHFFLKRKKNKNTALWKRDIKHLDQRQRRREYIYICLLYQRARKNNKIFSSHCQNVLPGGKMTAALGIPIIISQHTVRPAVMHKATQNVSIRTHLLPSTNIPGLCNWTE